MSTQVTNNSDNGDCLEPSPKGNLITMRISHLSLDTEVDSYTIEDNVLTLDILPSELLLLIFSYIEATDLIENVSKVCRKFFILLSSTYWKTRLTMWYHPCKYPPVSVDHHDFDWMKACKETEYTYSLWQNNQEKLEHLSFANIQYGTVDALHLFQDGKLLAAGSRDRSIKVFDLTRPEVKDAQICRDAIVFSDDKTHQGWIWCISSNDKYVCTGSWDSKIRLWDLWAENPLLSTYRCKSAVLDIYMDNNLIIAGGYDKCLYMIDTRTGSVTSTKIHQMPILCMAVNDKHIITGSEDGHICVYDRKFNGILKKITMPNYPMCLSYSNHQLWVGDRIGQVQLIDATQDKFEIVQTYDFGHKNKLTCIKHSLGALFTSSTDRNIRVMEPTLQPKQIVCFDPKLGEIACMDFCNSILTCAGSNFCVDVWRPKEL